MVQGLKQSLQGHLVIGLTGCFGSGKSTVAHLFEELGAFRVDADALAHEALLPGSEVYAKITAEFPEVTGANGEIDRAKLAGEIFGQAGKRKKLEAIIHPYVFQRIASEVSDADEKIAVVEVPLLFETGFDQYCAEVVVVAAEEKQVIERLSEKGFNRKDIEARLKAQMPLNQKKDKASFVVDNSKGFEETKKQVEKIWKKIHSISKGV